MKMIVLFLNFLLSPILTQMIASENKLIKFSFASPYQVNVNGVIMVLPEPAILIVTIKDKDGNSIADRKALTLYKKGDENVSFPFSIQSNSENRYVLTEAFVLDSEHRLICVAPKINSALAHLVRKPLDIEFTLSDDTTIVTIDVLDLMEKKPKDFGHARFNFISLACEQIDLSVYIKGVRNFEMIESHLIIEGISEASTTATVLWTFATTLEARTYTVKLRQAPAYRLLVSRIGFTTATRFIIPQKETHKVSIRME